VTYDALHIVVHARLPANTPRAGQLHTMHCMYGTFQTDMLISPRNVERLAPTQHVPRFADYLALTVRLRAA
jgi:hypothetical protein